MSSSESISLDKVHELIQKDTFDFFIKVILFIIFISLLCVLLSSFTAPISCDCGENCKCKLMCLCGNNCPCNNKENFASVNTQPQQPFDQNYNKQYLNYQRVSLISPNNEDTNTTQNLLFGEAQRYILSDNSIKIEITADLYVLTGDIYDSNIKPTLGLNDLDVGTGLTQFTPTNDTDKYTLYYSKNENSPQIFIGNLYKDGDGLYKLKTTLQNVSVKDLNNLYIYYESVDKTNKVLVLIGTF